VPHKSFTDRIAALNNDLMHEQMLRQKKIRKVQEYVSAGGESVLKEGSCTRLLQGIRRHDTMITVYETSLSALEEMKANLEAQRISTETTQMLRMSVGPTVDLDALDDSLVNLEEVKEQRSHLAAMMASTSDDLDATAFASSLGIVPRATDPAVDVSQLPDVPREQPGNVDFPTAGGAAELAERAPVLF